MTEGYLAQLSGLVRHRTWRRLLWVTGINISSSPQLPNWAVKAHGAPGTISNVSSSIDPATIIDISSKMSSTGILR